MNQEIILAANQPIEAYNEFRAQLTELKDTNAKMVFDYSDETGISEAKSYIYKLRQTKTAIEKVRKAEKKASLEYGRNVDGQAKDIASEIDTMIEVHQKPIDEIDLKEANRILAHKTKIADIESFLKIGHPENDSIVIRKSLELLEAKLPTQEFEEFYDLANETCIHAITHLKRQLELAETAEVQQAEIDKLKNEAALKEQTDRNAEIARNAAAEAETHATEARAREEQTKKNAAEAAVQAEEKRKQAVIDTENRIKQEAATQEAAEQAATAERESDIRHNAKVNNEALTAFIEQGVSEGISKVVITAIAKKLIPHITINY